MSFLNNINVNNPLLIHWKGIDLKVSSKPHWHGVFEKPYFRSWAIDSDGNDYTIIWDTNIKHYHETIRGADLSNACDWSNPREVIRLYDPLNNYEGDTALNHIIGVEDAAKILDLSPGTVKNMCAAGKIPAKKIGKTWILNKNLLEPSK
ncbi:helix-turn-helix domain-containing protein [Bacillus pacificus]|uniref:helix-turn-helix domain-containing protein n=1 Tax=Bacillus pacificus TaxID=2026187 RepID=UPI003D6460BF